MSEEQSIIHREPLDAEAIDIANKVIQETDLDKTKNLLNLFNLNAAKKNVVRALKLDGLLDKISSTMVDRFEKHPEEISNEDLLKYMQTVQTSLEKSNKIIGQVEETPAIQLQQNNQINVNINEPQFDSESKQRITDAIQAILQRVQKDKIIEYTEEEQDANE